MKTKLKKLTSALLVLCMVLGLLPAGVFADETATEAPVLPKELAAVTATTSVKTVPEGETAPGDVTITTANMFLNDRKPELYLEMTGLTPSVPHYVTIKCGDIVILEDAYTFPSVNNGGFSKFNVSLAKGALPTDVPSKLTVDIRYARESVDDGYVYRGAFNTATLTTHMVSSLPGEEILQMNSGRKLISTASLRPNASTIYLPYKVHSLLSGKSDLNVELVGADKSVYAVTVTQDPSASLSTYTYNGYKSLFATDFAPTVDRCYFSTSTMYTAKPLVAGLYDLKIYDGDTLLYTVEDMIQAVDCPLVTHIGVGGYDEYATLPGFDTFYARLGISNGDPADFTVQVWYDGVMLGSSSAYRVDSAYEETATVTYTIPLSELVGYGTYTVKVVSDQTFDGKTSQTCYFGQYNTYKAITDVAFGSRYYANLLVCTEGYDPQETYQAKLYAGSNSNGTLLSTVYVSPDENGLFDIEFTDEEGLPVSISGYDSGNVNGHYHVELCTQNENTGAWSNAQGKNVSNYERYMVSAALSEQSTETTLPVDVAHSSASFYSGEAYAYLRLKANGENFDAVTDKSKFSLKATDVLGKVYTLTELTAESEIKVESYSGEKTCILFFDTEEVPFGNYTFELLYGGVPVVNADTKKNVMAQSYVSSNNDFPHAQVNAGQNSVTGLIYAYGLYGYNLTAKDLRLDLFTLTNRTTTPDFSFALASPADRDSTALTAQQLAQLSPITAYRSEVYQNDVPINADDYAYFADRDSIWTNPEDQTTHSITAATVENGILTILPATDATVATDAIPALTDVYVLARPAEGYRLKAGSITVNGEKLMGRGFPVTEDAVVSAEFEIIPKETYSISVNTNLSTGTITADKTKAAEGETVTVTFTPKEGYVLKKNPKPYYYLKSNTGTTVDLTENADGTWSFTMPADAVGVEGAFRTMSNWTISTSDSGARGFVTVSDYNPAEGSTVVVTVTPLTGYELSMLHGCYSNADGVLVTVDLMTTPGSEPNTYLLTLPSKDMAQGTLSMTVMASFTERQSYAVNGITSTAAYGWIDLAPSYSNYAGDTVTVSVNANDGYKLVDGSLRAYMASSGTQLPLTANADGTWSFTMPAQDVTLYYEFEERPLYVPGGTITSPETLLAALGGSDYATLKDGVVRLDSSVILESALNITAGTMTLDLNGKTVRGAASAPVLQLSGTANLTVINDSTGAAHLRAAVEQHAVLVNGGELCIQSDRINIFGGENDEESVTAPVSTICVKGGNVTLGSPVSDTEPGYLVVEEFHTASALEVSGGSVTLRGGDYCGATGILVKNSGSLFMSGGWGESMGGGAALHVDSSATGTVKLYAAKLNGEELGLAIDSTSASVHLETVSVMSDGTAFRAPAGKGLQDYIASGYLALDQAYMALSSQQLAASTLEIAFRVAKTYTVTASDAEHGRIWVEKQSHLPTFEVVVSVKADLGYELDELTYTYTNEDGKQMTGCATYTPGMGYWFPMPEADVTVSATFEPVPENMFLQTNRFSIHSGYWNSQINAGLSLDYNTSYASFTLVNAAGEVVYTQENHGAGTWMELNNPGGLPAGKYKLYAALSDANQTHNLGWQSVELVDGYSYSANPNNGNLSIWTSEFDANVYIECLPGQLPDGLTLELVDQSTGQVLASSSSYTIRYEGGASGTAANGKDEDGGQSTLRFHLDLGDYRLASNGSYLLQLTGESELLNRNVYTQYIQTYPQFVGSYDESTLTWTGTAQGIPSGSYEAYSNNYVINGLTCVVAEDGTATVQFFSDPYEAEGQSWVNINVNVNGSVYTFSFSNGEGSEWYQLEVDGLAYLYYNGGSIYIQAMIPYPADGNYTLRASVPGYTGAGSYQIRDNYSNTLAQGELDDQASFSAALTAVAAGEYYQIWVYNEKGTNIAQTDVQFRHELALGLASSDDLYDGDSTLTMIPLNLSAAEVASLTVGYTTMDGRKTLPCKANADGTITVDLSGMPSGRYRLWAQFTSEDGGTCGLIVPNNPVESGKNSGSSITVADLKPVKNAYGVLAAAVEYEGGTPACDVLMDVFRLEDGVLSFVTTQNIGKGSYTIDSEELGLAGSYVFYFRTSADNAVLGVKVAEFVTAYSVTFLDWDGSVLSQQTVEPGAAAVAPADPSREGYTFLGWSDKVDAVTRNLTVTARYSKDSVTVTFSVGAGAGAPAAITLENGAALEVAPTEEPTRDGYEFTGWYTDPRGKNPYKFGTAVTGDMILYAGWEACRYTATTSGDAMFGPWTDASMDGPFLAGETILLEISSMAARITSLTLLDSEGKLLQEIPVVQEDFARWTASFTMPAQDVEIHAETEPYAGVLYINSKSGANIDTLQVVCYEGQYSRYYSNLTAGMRLSDLPYGTYYVTATVGAYTWNESVTLTAENPSNYVNLYVADDRYSASGTISGAGETLWLYAYHQATGAYAGCADYDYKAGTFSFVNLASGTYSLSAYDEEGQLRLNMTSFTVADEARTDLALTVTQPLSVAVFLPVNKEMDAQTAYLYLEKKVGTTWNWVASQSIQTGSTALFTNAIAELDDYRIRLDWLARANGAGISFKSEDVTFSVTEDMLKEGFHQTSDLTYTPSVNVLEAFSGAENLVALSKSDVYPGDYVELTIRYSAPTAVAPTFSLTLPAGVTRLDETSLTVTEPAQTGTIRLALKVGKEASGALAIPVKVTLNGQSADFGTAAMSVAGVTLSAEPSVMAGDFFRVYGEAAPGSTVEVFNRTTGTLLASVPVSGRFYSAKVALPYEGTFSLQAQVSSNGNVVKSEQVEVTATADPIYISSVWYDYSTTGAGTKAKLNTKLNQYTFCQYVDMELMGYDLPIGVLFENDANISQVKFTFCGQSYFANETWRDGERVWHTTFPAGQWGGSGLKTITAEVTTYNYMTNSYFTYAFDVALVNLLIDPSGVVTDETGKPLAGVTVTCQVFEDGKWVDLDAEAIGQVNPQVTDADGRYGWNVPEGKYRVLAVKEGYQPYDSSEDETFGVLDIPPARNDIDFSMVPLTASYAIYPTLAEGASVSVDSSAVNGETVSMTVVPLEGLLVESVSVTMLSGIPVQVTAGENGTYSFRMPTEDVTYTVSTASQVGSSVEIVGVDNSGKVTLNLTKLDQNATVLLACYDGNGKMQSVKDATIQAGTIESNVRVTLAEDTAFVRVFLLDPTGRTPLMACDDYCLSN